MKTVYPTKFQYKGKLQILLWKEGGDYEDRFLLDEDGNLIKGETIEQLRGLADKACNPNSVDWSYDYIVDMDEITETLRSLTPGQEIPTTACDLLLNGWNFIDDLLHTMEMPRTYEKQDNESINRIYERILGGNNLETLTPPGESWHPVFSEPEILSVQQLFISILAMLEKENLI